MWRKYAECIDTSTDLFFPSPKLTADELYQVNQIAVEVCKVCNVQEACLEYAITNPALVLTGTWGGKTFKQLKRIRRRR